MKTLSTFVVVALSAAGFAQYYSVDVTHDDLYTINVTTGAATYVGPLGVDVGSVDLAWHKGALYAKSFGTGNGSRVYQIVTDGAWAGYALPGSAANGGGYQGAEFAGLASNGAILAATFSNQPAGNLFANQFATVNPLSGLLGTPTLLPMDGDAMGFSYGQFWAVDIIAPGSGCDIYRGTAAPTTFVGNMSYDTTLETNPVDMEVFSTTQLVAMGQTGRRLVRVFMSNGSRGSSTPITGIPTDAVMKGIALRPGCSIPIIWR